MKKATIILTVLFAIVFTYEVYGQQDVQNANAPKLLPMEKIENPKTPKKSSVQSSATKMNAPTLGTGTIIQEKPKEVPANEKNNAPTLSNQNEIIVPKKDKE